MKKIIPIVLLVAVILCMTGCDAAANADSSVPSTDAPSMGAEAVTETETSATASPTTDPTTEPTDATTEPKPQNGVYGDTIVLGNLKFNIPDGFTVTVTDENTFFLASADNDCFYGLFAADISQLDEELARVYIPMQRESFVTDGTVRLDEDTVAGFIGGFDVALDLYGELNSDLQLSTNMDTTFTDSWYAYTILFKCADTENLSAHVTTFVQFTGYAEYTGESPRFDFVQ